MKLIIKSSIFLLLALILPAIANAQSFEVDGIYYYLNGTEAIVTGDSNYQYQGNVTIPSDVTYNGTTYSVTSIDNFAFSECTRLTSIDIPNSVTSIGTDAFFGCSGLTSINIPNSVTYIGMEAFFGCTGLTSIDIPNSVTDILDFTFKGCTGLTSINIPNSVTQIGYEAFLGCSGLTSIDIPNSVTAIGDNAFSGCTGLASVVIGNAVTSISNSAFNGCTGLTSISVNNGNPKFDSRNNCNAIIETASNSLVFGCRNTIIPNSVTTISDYAFNGCTGLTSIDIPNSVTAISNSAFNGCTGLTSISVDNGNPKFDSRNNCNAIIETASNSLFFGCRNTTIPNSVTSIGNSAFAGCSGLTSIDIPNSVISIGGGAFYRCTGLTSIDIPNSVISIGGGAFSYCTGLTSINIPNSVTSIGLQAFYYCIKLTSINIPNAVTSIDDDAFRGCTNLTSVNIGNSVTSIGKSAFSGCTGLTSIDIPNSVTSIGNSAFSSCSGLASITIGNSVTAIGDYAFSGCIGLTSISVDNGNSKFDSRNNCNAIIETASNSLVFGCKNTTIPNSVTSIGNYAFYRCTGLTSVNIPNSVTSIGNSAFVICTGLTSVNIGNSVTSIGSYAFDGCTGLTSVNIPNSVTSIGRLAFNGCSGLTSISVDNGNSIYDSRNNCNAIIQTASNSLVLGCRNATIPNSVTSIGDYAFSKCTGLTSIEIPNAVTSIGEGAFIGCSGLTSINIPNAVTSISSYAFRDCTGLTTVNIGNSVTSIGKYAFNGCTGLTSVNIGNSVTSIGSHAFYECPNIDKVTSLNVTPPACSSFDYNVYNQANLYVPKESVSKYKASAVWRQFIHIIGINTSNDVIAESIFLSHSLVNIDIGSTTQLIATVLPDSTTNKTILWTIDNQEVATVDSTGFVSAIAPGTATITASTTDGSNLSASCTVVVNDDLSQYANYLSLNDVEAFHGDTIVIPVAMTNSASITAFQTDIFLPEGLELLQEDGEYIIDPSERMTRTHSIMSNDVSGGAVRVICYSTNYKPFTGESGEDLFYITIKIADDAEGDYTIQLKNTLLTNTDFIDIAAPDVAANVYVKAYLPGDANGNGEVSVTDVVVTAQYILEMNPNPFVFEAADVNLDETITVADVARIAWMVLNPTQNAPRRMPPLTTCNDRMSAEGIALLPGETRRVSILFDNVIDYSAFQFDLTLPDGLTASNFQLTDRATSHAFDVNTLSNGKTRTLCYSPTLATIDGHEGALLSFDVTATASVVGDINVDGIELVTADCQTVLLDAFTISVNNTTNVNELNNAKTVARVDYYNLAGQQIDHPVNGVTLVVTTYTDGTRTTTKVIQ